MIGQKALEIAPSCCAVWPRQIVEAPEAPELQVILDFVMQRVKGNRFGLVLCLMHCNADSTWGGLAMSILTSCLTDLT